ncbi:MAG TPA: SpoIID/LytB domain-containing protein [bacterium]
MKPPLLKVAMILGKENVRGACQGKSFLVRSDNSTIELPSGEFYIELMQSRPSAMQRWIWLGNSSEQNLEGWLSQALKSDDLIICFQPVGLTPGGEGWKTRSYRILARSAKKGLTDDELQKLTRKIPITAEPVFLEMPSGSNAGLIQLTSRDGSLTLDLELPVRIESESSIRLIEAPVGEGFHWEHTEALELTAPVWMAADSSGKLCAGVEVEVEDYLASVNSSEMPAESPLEFLKAQVIAARSWLLANWGSHHPGEPFTVCGGDHCQCYYGPNRIRESSLIAARDSAGVVLTYDNSICDARYAKSCGGFTEPASNVWPFVHETYLGNFRDLPDEERPKSDLGNLDLTCEDDFRRFQLRQETSDACCSPGYAPLEGRLADLTGLYRWREHKSLGELREIIKAKTGEDLGEIEDLIPGRRGPSGRLMALTIVGRQARYVASPELEIRRVLSKTHLPSSAFWVDRQGKDKIILHGLGWGHGVGLCQVGAAAMAARGYPHERILAHYYPNTTLKKIY